MNMPGFTAQVSLYRSSVSSGARASQSFSSSGSVQPAKAIYVNGRFYCNGEISGHQIRCYDQGGGPQEPPELVCGPCRRGRQTCFLPGVGTSTGPCVEE